MFSASTKSAHPSGAVNWIDDVFSTYLYTGNGSTQTITNGIDLAGKGGMVWNKSRNDIYYNYVNDTVRGAGYQIYTNATNAQAYNSIGLTSFTNSGFTLGNDGGQNYSGNTYASWTFRKQAKFFDVVTYTGNGASSRFINHALTSTPGAVFIKRTDTTSNWVALCRTNTGQAYLRLNSTAAHESSSGGINTNGFCGYVDNITFGVYAGATDNSAVNASGGTYVAYLFAHDAGGFGTAGTDNVISCGSFTTDASGIASINLGYEAQYVMFKKTSATGDWHVFDVMRGMSQTTSNGLYPNLSIAEVAYGSDLICPTATGFRTNGVAGSSTFIYIAIRRPMKPPTTGTSVFMPIAQNGGNGTGVVTTNFPVDFSLSKLRGYVGSTMAVDRLRGSLSTGPMARLFTADTSAEASNLSYGFGFDNNNGYLDNWYSANPAVYWNFRRAPGFFDEVCYTGNGSANRVINHNLVVAPELIIKKDRNDAFDWNVQVPGTLGYSSNLTLNSSNANTPNGTTYLFSSGNATSLTTATNFDYINALNTNYVVYLFATVAGVSKVGSYTGTGTTNQINCGFTGGARFVLIKRTDSTGDWYVWDSARGIVSGNDPYLLLNSTAAEVTNTDYVDTYSAGFEISSTAPAAINANGGSFIYLAIA